MPSHVTCFAISTFMISQRDEFYPIPLDPPLKNLLMHTTDRTVQYIYIYILYQLSDFLGADESS
jgi:hypothetical protein